VETAKGKTESEVVMYSPTHFREDRRDVQFELIRQHPLGLLISAGPGGLKANPLPFVLHEEEGEPTILRSHLARANDQWKDLGEVSECLVVFQGPEAYVTPSWYQTKQETGKVVPTWNYAMVQVWGRPRVIDDRSWLHAQVNAITDHRENERDKPWHVNDAPDDYIASQLRGIIGLEIEIAKIEGKWKVSQNRPEEDREGVFRGLQHNSEPQEDMAKLVAQYGKLKHS
jgi:transcriptional regulator